jgi:arylformamidase
MADIVEISGTIEPGLWDYNVLDLGGVTLPDVAVQRIAGVARDGFDAHEMRLHSLSGTYTETAAHLIEGAATLDALELTELIRPAKIMRLGDLGPRALIGPDALMAAAPALAPGDALIIDTGWGRRWNQPGYVSDAPAFSARTLPWLLEQPFSILAVDTPVMECQWCAAEGRAADAGELLRPLYERGMVLLAPVVNLDRIGASEGTLITLPLRVAGVCAAPCRAAFIADVDWSRDVARDAPHQMEEES